MNVIYGCNEQHAVVPSVRGKEQSRPPQAIELKWRARSPGLQGDHLLGQNIDAYGRDLPGITPEVAASTPSPICSTTFTT